MPERLTPAKRIAQLEACRAEIVLVQATLSDLLTLDAWPRGKALIVMANDLLAVAAEALDSAADEQGGPPRS